MDEKNYENMTGREVREKIEEEWNKPVKGAEIVHIGWRRYMEEHPNPLKSAMESIIDGEVEVYELEKKIDKLCKLYDEQPKGTPKKRKLLKEIIATMEKQRSVDSHIGTDKIIYKCVEKEIDVDKRLERDISYERFFENIENKNKKKLREERKEEALERKYADEIEEGYKKNHR